MLISHVGRSDAKKKRNKSIRTCLFAFRATTGDFITSEAASNGEISKIPRIRGGLVHRTIVIVEQFERLVKVRSRNFATACAVTQGDLGITS